MLKATSQELVPSRVTWPLSNRSLLCCVRESLEYSKGTASCTCISRLKTLYVQSEVVGCCLYSSWVYAFLMEKVPRRKLYCGSSFRFKDHKVLARLAFPPLRTGNHFRSSWAMTRARDPILQQGTWTGC